MHPANATTAPSMAIHLKNAARDPGLQPERTRLAWLRTSATLVSVLVLGIRMTAEQKILWPLLFILLASVSVLVMLRRFSDLSVLRPTSDDATLRHTALITSLGIVTNALLFLSSRALEVLSP